MLDVCWLDHYTGKITIALFHCTVVCRTIRMLESTISYVAVYLCYGSMFLRFHESLNLGPEVFSASYSFIHLYNVIGGGRMNIVAHCLAKTVIKTDE